MSAGQYYNTTGLLRGGIHRVSWIEEAARLREQPGQWFMITDRETNSRAYTMASQINRGVLCSFRPAGDFEAERRGSQVWARYLGDGALPDDEE